MKKLAYFLPAAAYYVLVFIVSSSDIGISIDVLYFDKAAHFAEYGILGFLLAFGFFNVLGTPLAWKFILSFFTCITLAGLDEFHQFFVPWRQVEILDLLADSLGAAAGVLFFLILYARKKWPKSGRPKDTSSALL